MLLHVESVADKRATKILAKHLQKSEKQDLKKRRIRDDAMGYTVMKIVSYIDIIDIQGGTGGTQPI